MIKKQELIKNPVSMATYMESKKNEFYALPAILCAYPHLPLWITA
jgi:hypothetical protein